MTGQLQFEQLGERSWIAELDGGAFYRIEMYPGKLGSDYDLTFIERQSHESFFSSAGRMKHESVSEHRSLERAIERANRHHRNRAQAS